MVIMVRTLSKIMTILMAMTLTVMMIMMVIEMMTTMMIHINTGGNHGPPEATRGHQSQPRDD